MHSSNKLYLMHTVFLTPFGIIQKYLNIFYSICSDQCLSNRNDPYKVSIQESPWLQGDVLNGCFYHQTRWICIFMEGSWSLITQRCTFFRFGWFFNLKMLSFDENTKSKRFYIRNLRPDLDFWIFYLYAKEEKTSITKGYKLLSNSK